MRKWEAIATALLAVSGSPALLQSETGSASTDPSSRIYVPDSGQYDPLQWLGAIGVIDGKTVSLYDDPTFKKPTYKPALTYVNKQAYKLDVNEKNKGDISIPIIGGAAIDKDHHVEVSVIDVGYADIPKGSGYRRCQAWAMIRGTHPAVGTKIIYITHVALSEIGTDEVSSSQNNGHLGVGSYFQIGADLFQSSEHATNVPAISVNGIVFDVTDALLKQPCVNSEPPRVLNTLKDLYPIGQIGSVKVRAVVMPAAKAKR